MSASWAGSRLVRRAIAVLVLLFPMWPGHAAAESADRIEVTAELTSQHYCSLPHNSVSLQLKIRLHYRNLADEAVVLARPLVFGIYVAGSTEAGERNEFEMSLGPADWPGKPRFGSRPSPAQFLVVQRMGSEVVDVEVPVEVSRLNDKMRRLLVVEGRNHVLKLSVVWTGPFDGMPDRDFSRIEEKWRRWGRIVKGVGRTTWVPFSTPEIPTTMEGCPW